MASWRAYWLSWYLWFTVKGYYASAEALQQRLALDRQKPVDNEPPAQLGTKFIIDRRKVQGHVVYDISTKSETPNKARILYLHGGSFLFDIRPQHWALIATLAERLEAVVTVPLYPLGPESKLKDMYAFLQPLHDEMVASREDAPLFVIGDSAGGTMALVLTQEAIKVGKRTAAGLVAITPVVDATWTNPEVYAVAPKDPWLDIPGVKEAARLVRGDWPLTDRRVSPWFGELSGLPPLMVLAAENDILGPDARRFAAKVKAAGRDVTLVEGHDLMHVWPVVLPDHDGREAIDGMVSWLDNIKSK
ncbi:esterase [Moelleriella libera RCEF 2490]|uniref:Esterase n=1 Tax=Moelleriella libera RCEF 2490 TaxID=1081109 RepID=A0A166NYU1_9HYPO|nr:esterase [Moelleriella libera RCEF 2490]